MPIGDVVGELLGGKTREKHDDSPAKTAMKNIILVVSSFLLLCQSIYAENATDEAQKLFQSCQKSVYQIQVIDLATGKKSSLGSGFQFTQEGQVATNFHVLSEAIHDPRRFRIEYIRHDGVTGPLTILDFDIIHDLAIAQIGAAENSPLTLGKSELLKGARIFSMGNPHDLGMTIIEGTYNGLMERSLYRKILFSGSLNPGMSGGPALDHEGRVIGINVSTQGNQVSFLVPVEYLRDLYKNILAHGQKMEEKDWAKYIEKQLVDNQNQYVASLLTSEWSSLPIGDAHVPGEIFNVFKCWGESKDEEDKLFNYASIQCSSEDAIFVSSDFITGQIVYKYNWITSKGLDPFRFYNLYRNSFEPTGYENAGEKDVTNFECKTEFVNIAGGDWKVGYCARNYKNYPSLYDINLSLASVDKQDRGLLIEVVALGISQVKANAFIQRFLKELKWQK